MVAAGLTAANREKVALLRRAFPGPFTAAQAAQAAGLAPKRASRLLRHLVAQGWLTRIRRGLYAAVPLEAEDPQGWHLDPWTVAATALRPCYVGGWTALHHWDLTDQLFSTTVVITSKPVARRKEEIGGAILQLRHRPTSALFGTRRVWREGVPVDVSDPERTIVDCLDDPSLGGGIRHVAEAVVQWHATSNRSTERLLEYAERLGNRTIFKRLGYILEALGIEEPDLITASRDRISRGVGLLDPGRPSTGSITTRWNLRVNAVIEP
ncbi:MAG TPA: type IV toxin-antitoxin system AbiEi family antitoxin domain-containing protein [Solirubrobacteraceae bacterium]|nr:type IV toxin-antitoxin system AbiEi family antitoxin domain-containing protein [Solirubrobacteraceae bacterium]